MWNLFNKQKMSLLSLIDALTLETFLNRMKAEDLVQSFSFLLTPRFNGLLQASWELVDSYGLDQFSLQLVTTQPVSPEVPPTRFFWRLPAEHHHHHYHINDRVKPNMIVLHHYCPCRLFLDQARTTSEDLLCKHIIATRIAFALKRYKNVVVKETDFLQQICTDC